MPTNPAGSPLTDEHLQTLNTALQQLADLNRQIDLATRAGIDVSAQKAEANALEAKIRQVKSVYFPNA